MNTQNRTTLIAIIAFGMLTVGSPASAGVFNIPRFIPSGQFALGVEPELSFGTKASVGVNAKYTHGISDLSNLQIMMGTASGTKKFRLGGAYTFDFIPDLDNQPGIGIATQLLYYRLAEPATSGAQGQLEGSLIPYIHKAFSTATGEVDPFVAFPVGIALYDDRYKNLATAVIGAIFKSTPHVAFTIELGVAVLHTDSYVSAGVIYYH